MRLWAVWQWSLTCWETLSNWPTTLGRRTEVSRPRNTALPLDTLPTCSPAARKLLWTCKVHLCHTSELWSCHMLQVCLNFPNLVVLPSTNVSPPSFWYRLGDSQRQRADLPHRPPDSLHQDPQRPFQLCRQRPPVLSGRAAWTGVQWDLSGAPTSSVVQTAQADVIEGIVCSMTLDWSLHCILC